MNAFRRGLSASMRSRHDSSTATAEGCFDRTRRAKSSMVKGLSRIGNVVRVAAETGSPEQLRGLREPLEQRFELGQSATFGVGDGGFQPVFDCHDGCGRANAGAVSTGSGLPYVRLTEMATPSRSGTVAVMSCGCAFSN